MQEVFALMFVPSTPTIKLRTYLAYILARRTRRSKSEERWVMIGFSIATVTPTIAATKVEARTVRGWPHEREGVPVIWSDQCGSN